MAVVIIPRIGFPDHAVAAGVNFCYPVFGIVLIAVVELVVMARLVRDLINFSADQIVIVSDLLECIAGRLHDADVEMPCCWQNALIV